LRYNCQPDAAGEVIERPGYSYKETVETVWESAATEIDVTIEGSRGVNSIQVREWLRNFTRMIWLSAL